MGAISSFAKRNRLIEPAKTVYLRFRAIIVIILVVSAGFPGLNSLPLFDWDEINFAESGREMIETGNFLQPTVNYLPFHEKPPLFTWIQVASFNTFGVNSRGARFPNVLCGLLTVLLLWRLGKENGQKLKNWFPAFLGLSVLPLLYFRSGIIDPWFNLLILAGLYPSLCGRTSWKAVASGGLFLGLAVLTKGPAAGLIAGLCWVCLLWCRPARRGKQVLRYFMTGMLALLPIAIWLVFLWREDDGFFAREFLTYQWRLFSKEDAGHGGFPGYHAVVLLLGCFPAGVFALPALFRRKQFNLPLDTGMRILFWVVLILFSVVSTKIIHYSSLAYFPLAWFAARGIQEGMIKKDWARIRSTSLVIWSLYALVAILVPLLARNLVSLLPYTKDAELIARLSLPVDWPWYTFVPAVIVLLGIGGLIWARQQTASRIAVAQLALSALFVLSALPVFAPRIQQYTQGALIAFFEDLAGQDVYYGTAYHKSYAHWFYGEVRPEVYADGCQARECRFHEPIGKPLYFSSPLRKTDQVLREVPDAELLYQRGGFSFYRRPVNSSR